MSWGTAIEAPGSAALNTGGGAEVGSVSCGSAGNCAAGGAYADGSGHFQALVESEKNGVWGNAIEVPGTAALNTRGFATVTSESCVSAAGNCTAGGSYQDLHGHEAFVVSEKSGVWGKAIEVPGTAALNTRGSARVSDVSCASAGNCAAGGGYANGPGAGYQVFVVSEKKGVWGKAIEVPGTAALNHAGLADVNSVSCGSAGNCAVGGYYSGSHGREAFVASEKKGVWGKAIEVPGTAALNTGGSAEVGSVSCVSAGNCAAGGSYSADHLHAFVVSEKNGVWGKAIEVPGTALLNGGGYAQVQSISCASAGNCAAGGYYRDGSDNGQAFVVSEKHGVWGKAIEVPGTAELNAEAIGPQVSSVSCASAGNCAAGGTYFDGSGFQAFVVGETNGVWGTAIEVPGTAALNTGVSDTPLEVSVSCASTGACVIGGDYKDGSGVYQAFVTVFE